jgi:hypothetical protein
MNEADLKGCKLSDNVCEISNKWFPQRFIPLVHDYLLPAAHMPGIVF